MSNDNFQFLLALLIFAALVPVMIWGMKKYARRIFFGKEEPNEDIEVIKKNSKEFWKQAKQAWNDLPQKERDDITITAAKIAQDNLQDFFFKPRSIICKNDKGQEIAVVTFKERPSFANTIGRFYPESSQSAFLDPDPKPKPPKQKPIPIDAELSKTLAAVLKSNPTPDLKVYERSFNIEIINVQILKIEKDDDEDNDIPIGWKIYDKDR